MCVRTHIAVVALHLRQPFSFFLPHPARPSFLPPRPCQRHCRMHPWEGGERMEREGGGRERGRQAEREGADRASEREELACYLRSWAHADTTADCSQRRRRWRWRRERWKGAVIVSGSRQPLHHCIQKTFSLAGAEVCSAKIIA